MYERMKDSDFTKNLLNTLKNKRRLQILDLISKGKQPVSKIQRELKMRRYYHSQQTITKEYLTPLIEVALAKESQGLYSATLLGSQLNKVIRSYPYTSDVLPAHSECYEEIVLDMMMNKPRAYEDFDGIIPTKSIARILNRLQNADLVETTKENDYVFFFRTKREPSKDRLSPTEKKIHESIPEEGISARRLCEKAVISLRRTYKYLRRLKGKKLVFVRKKLKTYALTAKGVQMAMMLRELNDLTLAAFKIASQAVNKEDRHELLMPAINQKSGKTASKSLVKT